MISGGARQASGPLAWEAGQGAEAHVGPVRVRVDAWLDDRDRLAAALGVAAKDHDDAALIALAYLRWGEQCCRHLLGDFAFALIDDGRQQVMLARDANGARPLHYRAEADRLLFAGDLARLLERPDVPRRLDEAVLAARFVEHGGSLPALVDGTFWIGIRKVAPGHSLLWREGRTRIDRWCRWEEAPDVRLGSEDAYAEALVERLDRAVRRCLTRSPRVASHLSGGIDSTLVSLFAGKGLADRNLRLKAAYGWLAPPDARSPEGDDQFAQAKAVADRLETPLHSAGLQPARLAALAAADFTRRPALMLEYELDLLRRARRDGVDLILSGWGGDDALSCRGSADWFDLLAAGRWRTAWALNQGGALSFARGVATWLYRRRTDGRSDRPHPAPPDWLRPPPFLAMEKVKRLCAGRADPFPAKPHPALGARQIIAHNLERGHLALRMESWALAGARYGVTYRYPLLDRELLEFCIGLPPLRRNRRAFLQEATATLLPPALTREMKPRESQRVARLGDADRKATELLIRHARARPVPRLFDWIDYPALDRIVAAAPDGDPAAHLARRQAARFALLSHPWDKG